ncbi:E3 ubiquitin-protein ligase RING2 homolog spat-3-like [Mercenaria mercenaria]|uniref:E3 ubiquitin-protein ligase RING2 homolog spat-3-like n=1 Tax=Mercenaria mercenaria TaxID=6596 RepID=UPI00234EBF34|nr:E3 ubiquitin-protein ligase RING2 homolog spat-3-like [Mercenaria mercenaria]
MNMAEKRVQELLGQMQKTLECSICLEMMKNPVSTGCGHQFCRFCLMEFLERKRQVPCPLCKKPITKRSLMKREQLGEMVEGVRSLISAFQKDTGALFSPPRGPQTSLLPGTPDAIQTKSSAGNKAGKNTGLGNVRRTKRKQHVDLGNAESPSLIDSSESLPVTKSSDQITGEKSKDLSKKETKEEDRRLELLKCIEEGTLNADEFLEDNNVVTEKEDNTEIGMKGKLKSSSRKNLERQSRTMLVSGKCDKKVEINLKDCTKGNKDKKQSEDVTVVKMNSVKFKNAKSIENKAVAETNESSVNDRSGDTDNENKLEYDPDEPVLSGASVAKESETSSGPLFKTPIDPRSLKHSKKGKDSSEHFEDISKKSLRSMDKKRNNDQGEVDTDGSGSVKLTPEVLVVKGKAVSRTYCKKDKDLFVKEKKATKKVADWLKNIPTIPNNANTVVDKDEITEVKERNQHRRLSKKKLKIMQEEEAMGSKIKHFAKQIQDNGKGVLFELDDFEGEDGSTVTDSTLRSDMEDVDKSLESDSQVCGENKNNNVVIDGKTGNFVDNDRTVDTDTEKNCNKDNDIVEELSEDKIGTEKAVGKEPVRKKRIFKSRSVPSAQSFIDKATVVDNNKNINLQKTESKEENNSVFGNEIIEIESQESELPSSDPYEFKSSQNTPKKVGKKKGKQKKGKLTNKAKGKQKRKENNVDVIQVQNKTGSKKFEKMWDKNLVPDKTILKTRNTEEIDKISASLQLAEDYDLLTCTQEAAESIAKEKEKSEAIASDVQKKVRFTEPVISDFIQTGKIDIIGYRKAREEFSVENNETGDEKNCEQKRKTVAEKCIEKKQIDVNDGENPLGQSSDSTEDVESGKIEIIFHEPKYCTCKFENFIWNIKKWSGRKSFKICLTIDIQPEEIKAQLSQELLENVVLETPLIPLNKASPNVIEETTAVFSVPELNKILSKPVRKSRKLGKVNTSFEADAKAETPDVSIYEQHKNTKTVKGEMFDKDSEIAKMEKDKLRSKKETKEKCMTDVNISLQHEKMKSDVDSLAESDETKSPDVELVLVQNTDNNKHEEYEQMQVDSDQEAVAVTSQEALNSESTLTQNSESLLQPSALKAKTLCKTGQRTDIYEHTSIINTEKEMQKQYKPNSKDDKDALVPGGCDK